MRVTVACGMRACLAWRRPYSGLLQQKRVSWLQEPGGREEGPPKGGMKQHYGSVVGAARLGERASIGNGYFMSAHGGAVRPT